MMSRCFIIVTCLALLTLTGCDGQDMADEKMAKGCAAGVSALIEPKEILEIKTIQYVTEDVKGEGPHRRIKIGAIEKDGWLELDKEYSCLFAEQWGMFRSTHNALLVQLTIDDDLYGKKDGEIVGNLNDFLALSGKVERAMGQ